MSPDLKREQPKVPVLVLSLHPERPVRQAGVEGTTTSAAFHTLGRSEVVEFDTLL